MSSCTASWAFSQSGRLSYICKRIVKEDWEGDWRSASGCLNLTQTWNVESPASSFLLMFTRPALFFRVFLVCHLLRHKTYLMSDNGLPNVRQWPPSLSVNLEGHPPCGSWAPKQLSGLEMDHLSKNCRIKRVANLKACDKNSDTQKKNIYNLPWIFVVTSRWA